MTNVLGTSTNATILYKTKESFKRDCREEYPSTIVPTELIWWPTEGSTDIDINRQDIGL